MQIEQSMYQASNNALKLAVDAQNEGLHQAASQSDLKDFDRKLSTSDELKAFDRKSREYEDTVVRDAAAAEKARGEESMKEGQFDEFYQQFH